MSWTGEQVVRVVPYTRSVGSSQIPVTRATGLPSYRAYFRSLPWGVYVEYWGGENAAWITAAGMQSGHLSIGVMLSEVDGPVRAHHRTEQWAWDDMEPFEWAAELLCVGEDGTRYISDESQARFAERLHAWFTERKA